MTKILTTQQMRDVDRLSTERFGIPSILLMENASVQLLRALEQRFPNLVDLEVTIVAGKGNNGGDGAALARQLLQRGVKPHFLLLAQVDEAKGDARTNLEILVKSGYPITEILSPEDWASQQGRIDNSDIVVDALLGTGLSKPAEGLYRAAIESINQSRAFVLAVDIPPACRRTRAPEAT